MLSYSRGTKLAIAVKVNIGTFTDVWKLTNGLRRNPKGTRQPPARNEDEDTR